jgi:hypothetical protein
MGGVESLLISLNIILRSKQLQMETEESPPLCEAGRGLGGGDFSMYCIKDDFALH